MEKPREGLFLFQVGSVGQTSVALRSIRYSLTRRLNAAERRHTLNPGSPILKQQDFTGRPVSQPC